MATVSPPPGPSDDQEFSLGKDLKLESSDGSTSAFTPASRINTQRDALERLIGKQNPSHSVDSQNEFDGYEIIEELGKGGMGVVYRARHILLGREVALKVMSPSMSNRASAIQRFLVEMKAVGELDHPHVVRSTHAGIVGDKLYLAMEILSGGSLENLLEKEGPLPSSRIVELGLGIALGLEAAHERNILHRDIKPGNVMLDATGKPKLTDFGLAKALDDSSEQNKTTDCTVLGTVRYEAPEGINGSAQLDKRSDLYSLGCLLFELSAGKTPFDDGKTTGPIQYLMAHAKRDVPDVNALRARKKIDGSLNLDDLPAELTQLIYWLLQKNPKDRPQSIADVVNALKALDSHQGELVVPSNIRRPVGQTENSTLRIYAKRVALALSLLAVIAPLANQLKPSSHHETGTTPAQLPPTVPKNTVVKNSETKIEPFVQTPDFSFVRDADGMIQACSLFPGSDNVLDLDAKDMITRTVGDDLVLISFHLNFSDEKHQKFIGFLMNKAIPYKVVAEGVDCSVIVDTNNERSKTILRFMYSDVFQNAQDTIVATTREPSRTFYTLNERMGESLGKNSSNSFPSIEWAKNPDVQATFERLNPTFEVTDSQSAKMLKQYMDWLKEVKKSTINTSSITQKS